MKSIYDFIVKPIGERYDNSIKVGDKSLIVNTKIESWKFVNNMAKVVAIPLAYKTDIKVVDLHRDWLFPNCYNPNNSMLDHFIIHDYHQIKN